MSNSPEQNVEQTSDDAESAAIRARMEAYVPPELDENGEVVSQAAVEKEVSAELKEAGSGLATDPTETIIFDMNNAHVGANEMSHYTLELPENNISHVLTGVDTLDHMGKYEVNQGYIAYVPNIEVPTYCLAVDTDENREKIASAGYEKDSGLGVLNFDKGESLKPRAATEHAEYIGAQVELLKAIREGETIKGRIEAAKEKTGYVGTVEQETAALEEQTKKIAELKAKAKQIVADQSWKGTTELAA